MTEITDDERLAEALDDCRRRVGRGESLERCAADYPAYADDIVRLVSLGQRLAQLGREPSTEFRLQLERRVLAAVDEQRHARRHGAPGGLNRLLVIPLNAAALALIALLVLVGSGVGVVNASEDSLPDSPLYHVKAAREWVEVALARDGESEVGVQARLVDQRGRELERASADRKPGKVVEVVAARLSRSIQRAADQALEARARGNPRPALRALVAIRTMQRHLERLEGQAGPEAKPVIGQLSLFLDQQERRFSQKQSTRPTLPRTASR